MTGIRRFGGSRGLLTAALLLIAGLLLAWTCMRVALSEALSPDTPVLAKIAPRDPNIVLARATIALVQQHGILDAAMLTAVQRAAASAPLDARPFLIIGHQQLLERRPARALATFQAGERLNPRQVLIHVLLLDRYLRSRRYDEAAPQLSVLSRMMGQNPLIAMAVAKMALFPDTREAAKRVLRTDPRLERAVLIALARHGVPPTTVFALASPSARVEAGRMASWGPVLINQLLAQGRFAEARTVWRQVYGISATMAKPPIFNAAFQPSPAAAPFNWTLVSGSIGAADMKSGGLAIDYYGRDSGDLASQLLVLAPGTYVFSFLVDPGKSDTASRLLWSLGCLGANDSLMNEPIAAGPSSRHLTATFVVPRGCQAEKLTLRGEAGEFPAPTSVTVRTPEIHLQTAAQR